MNRTICKAQPGRQWVYFGLFALTMFLLAISSMPSAAQKGPPVPPAPPAGWRVELEEGQKRFSTLAIRNTCRLPHRFRVQSHIKYLTFAEPTKDIEVRAASTTSLKAAFDATGLKSKTYHDKVIVDCLDCKKEKGCSQDRDEIPVELIVTKPAPPQNPDSVRYAVNETHLSTAQLKRVTSDEKFKAALEVVAGNNEAVDLKSARLLTSPSAPGLSEIAFNVTVKGTNKPGEYAKLIYMEQTGAVPIVFFDEKRIASVAVGTGQGGVGTGGGGGLGGLLDCLFASYGQWTVLNTYCGNNFWCFGKKQKALYLTETRSKTCKKGTFWQTRTVKVHCGC